MTLLHEHGSLARHLDDFDRLLVEHEALVRHLDEIDEENGRKLAACQERALECLTAFASDHDIS